uniref:p10 protein n=1 Tax=Avian orthoreovirus TaxID=38170 RepID=A3E172_9REOV|nr:p10 protein [Avian orthoreovirus]
MASDGSCNGLTSVFGNVHCQASQNSAGGDLSATTSLTAYWPFLLGGGAIVLFLIIIFAVLYCRQRIKCEATRNVFHSELLNLYRSSDGPKPVIRGEMV